MMPLILNARCARATGFNVGSAGSQYYFCPMPALHVPTSYTLIGNVCPVSLCTTNMKIFFGRGSQIRTSDLTLEQCCNCEDCGGELLEVHGILLLCEMDISFGGPGWNTSYGKMKRSP